MFIPQRGAVEVKVKEAKVRGHLDDLLPLHQALPLPAILDEGLDGAHLEPMLFGKGPKLWHACHGAVRVHDFDQDSRFL